MYIFQIFFILLFYPKNLILKTDIIGDYLTSKNQKLNIKYIKEDIYN